MKESHRTNPTSISSERWQQIVNPQVDEKGRTDFDHGQYENRGVYEFTQAKREEIVTSAANELYYDDETDAVFVEAGQVAATPPRSTIHEALIKLAAENGLDSKSHAKALTTFERVAVIEEMRHYNNPTLCDIVGLRKNIDLQREFGKTFPEQAQPEAILAKQESFLVDYAQYDMVCSDKKMRPISFEDYLSDQLRIQERRRKRRALIRQEISQDAKDTISALEQAISTLDSLHDDYDEVSKVLADNS